MRSLATRRAVLGGGVALGLAVMSRSVLGQPLEKWRHGIVQAKGDSAFFYMAQKK